ncbi:MAG: hypothetical protein MPJ08_07180 [Nitrosopumilus sp.]|nr:hypothetical protein [Nitrosopumilus sp.]
MGARDGPDPNYGLVVRIGRCLLVGPMTRTRLAGTCGINYCRCVRALAWMEGRRYVEVGRLVRLTPDGAALARMFV